METKELIKKYRLKAGLTQQQVADKLFVQKQTYNQYENGKRKIDTETFFKIAEIVNMNVAIRDKYHKKKNFDISNLRDKIKFFEVKKTEDAMIIAFSIDHEMFAYCAYSGEGYTIVHLENYHVIEKLEAKREYVEVFFALFQETYDADYFLQTCPFCHQYKPNVFESHIDSGVCTTLANHEFVKVLFEAWENMNETYKKATTTREKAHFIFFKDIHWGLLS